MLDKVGFYVCMIYFMSLCLMIIYALRTGKRDFPPPAFLMIPSVIMIILIVIIGNFKRNTIIGLELKSKNLSAKVKVIGVTKNGKKVGFCEQSVDKEHLKHIRYFERASEE